MLAPFATILVAVGTLVILGCNILVTGFFFRTPPRGDQGVGLVVMLIGFLVAAVLITLGSLLASFRSGRLITGIFHAPAMVTGALTVAVSFGVVLAAFMAFAAWAEPGLGGTKLGSLKPVLCWTLGIIAPIMLAIAIMLDASTPAQSGASQFAPSTALRGICWSLLAIAALGYLTGAAAFGRPLTLAITNALGSALSPNRQHALRPGMTPVLELREELDKLPPDAALSATVLYFANPIATENAECKALLTQRLLAMPSPDDQLADAMRSRSFASRWGGAEFIRTASRELLTEHEGGWAKALQLGIAKTADDMETRPSFLTENYELNPEPQEFLKSLLGAAERFRGTSHHEQLATAIQQLATSANALNRDNRWKKLAKVLDRGGYPIPAEAEAR